MTTIDQWAVNRGQTPRTERVDARRVGRFIFTVRQVIADRPAQLTQANGQPADNYVVFNAPRPLYGSIRGAGALVWHGDFITGAHYAAVDLADPLKASWFENNHKADAVIVRYVTEAEARAQARAYLLTQHSAWASTDEQTGRLLVDSDLFEEAWRNAFFDGCAVQEVTLV